MPPTQADDFIDEGDGFTDGEFYRKYEPKEVLGRGISSTVRKCVERGTHREYAVKIIDISGEKTPEYNAEEIRDQTVQEVTLLKLCADHPFVIELHDVFFDTETYIFLVFEICDGGELFDYLTQVCFDFPTDPLGRMGVVTLSEKRTRQVMRQLFDALSYMHSRSIVHRDVKPENILLDSQGNIKLSDFGFAVQLEEGQTLSELCGTPGYLAPEILHCSMTDGSDGYGLQVDMWSAGVVMYTLLVGFPPFWNRRQMLMLRMIMNGEYEFRSPEWDDISEIAKDLVSHLLIVDPAERLTANEALEHPFFTRELAVTREFFPRRKWHAAFFCLRFIWYLKYISTHPPAISLTGLRTEPYRGKMMRKLIDACAFNVYNHWVKKGEDQNRAALFEMRPKREKKLAMDRQRESLQTTMVAA